MSPRPRAPRIYYGKKSEFSVNRLESQADYSLPFNAKIRISYLVQILFSTPGTVMLAVLTSYFIGAFSIL